MTITIEGHDKFQARLQSLMNSEASIERAGVRAGCVVMANACRAAVPGTIKQEIGFHTTREGKRTVGRAGLMRFPRRGDGQDGPHGLYVDKGTRYIAPRHWIRTALQASRGAAKAAMARAIKRRIRAFASK